MITCWYANPMHPMSQRGFILPTSCLLIILWSKSDMVSIICCNCRMTGTRVGLRSSHWAVYLLYTRIRGSLHIRDAFLFDMGVLSADISLQLLIFIDSNDSKGSLNSLYTIFPGCHYVNRTQTISFQVPQDIEINDTNTPGFSSPLRQMWVNLPCPINKEPTESLPPVITGDEVQLRRSLKCNKSRSGRCVPTQMRWRSPRRCITDQTTASDN